MLKATLRLSNEDYGCLTKTFAFVQLVVSRLTRIILHPDDWGED